MVRRGNADIYDCRQRKYARTNHGQSGNLCRNFTSRLYWRNDCDICSRSAFVLIMLAVTAVLPKVIKNKYVQAALRGIKPSMIGIILATGCWMIFKNLFDSSFEKISIRAVIITAILCTVYFGQKKILKKSVSPIMLIVISALLGMVGYAL